MPSPHDSIETWTAGAQRVWQAARNQAATRCAEAVGVEHLLWGLLSVESRAAEQLQQAGVTTEAFQSAWGSAAEDVEASKTEGDELPRHDLVNAVLIEAQAELSSGGAGGELGTEHLLIGLCRVPSDVSQWLSQFGMESLSDASQKRVPTPRGNSEPLVTSPELQMAWRDPTQVDLFETYRILDAAANRAREGLRVVEDFVRWAWNDGFLSQLLKECRHELTGLLRQLPQPALLAARGTAHDVGTEIRTASEYRRETPAAVATASLKRIEEALRSLEEFSKVVDADLSPRFEQLRYRIYTLDKAIHSTDAARLRFADQKICLLATHSLCHHGIGPAILGALKAGVKMIQLREKSLPDRELIEIARYVRRWTKEAEAIFIVNDRPDIAALVNADGVHLGQDDLPVADARKILGPDKLVGVSTHSLEQARQAVLDGADYLGVGPCFPSSTKSFDKFPGLEFVQQVAGEISLPWFAIGGITAENLTELKIVGAARIAVSSAICSTEEPGWAAEELVYRLNQQPKPRLATAVGSPAKEQREVAGLHAESCGGVDGRGIHRIGIRRIHGRRRHDDRRRRDHDRRRDHRGREEHTKSGSVIRTSVACFHTAVHRRHTDRRQHHSAHHECLSAFLASFFTGRPRPARGGEKQMPCQVRELRKMNAGETISVSFARKCVRDSQSECRRLQRLQRRHARRAYAATLAFATRRMLTDFSHPAFEP